MAILRGRPRRIALAALVPLALAAAALAVVGSPLAEQPVRRLLEERINARLSGYRVEIGAVDLHPLAVAFVVRDLAVVRSEHPEPPVARIAALSTSVEWRALLRGALVADVTSLSRNYVRSDASAAKEPAAPRRAVRAVREVTQRPALELRADRIELRNGNVGMRNSREADRYRVFLSQLDLELENFSNRFRAGTGRARLHGLFMGSGVTDATASFARERSGPEFQLAVRIVDTKLREMNDLLDAQGKLDVAEGFFSFYSEIRVADGRIQGYAKPLFRKLDVYEAAQDRRDSLLRQAYEAVAGAVGELLENRPRDEVATTTDLSGLLENPEMDTWELIVSLVENAFVRALLPGFEREFGRNGGRD